jgi:hypothetical protein
MELRLIRWDGAIQQAFNKSMHIPSVREAKPTETRASYEAQR